MLRTSKETQKQNVPTSSPASANAKHPRRLPAHLSVSLRHGTPGLTLSSPSKHYSEEGRNSGDSTANARNWFDTSNKHPQAAPFDCEDNEPPYFLPQNSSKSSNAVSDQKHSHFPVYQTAVFHTETNDDSAGDFRSVIDDLTIENKKLKEKLRRYENLSHADLDKDKLFEVKIHALPLRKRRELENTLRAFASSLDESIDDNKSKISPPVATYPPHLAREGAPGSKHAPSSSTSNSRLVDSGYASMSNSGQNSGSNQSGLEGKFPRQIQGTEQNVQNYLHNIPIGLLPKHSPVLTEKQKKKIVVQRLEQLFTGKQGAIVGDNNQHAQQQEVSRSAARADNATDHSSVSVEGHREAHILPFKTDVDNSRPGKLSEEMSAETQISRGNSDSSNESSPSRSSPQQRPTRPLDLDPDRAQIPSENVEYIRHLGLSTPQLVSDDSTDSAADSDGWIYLNLLVNMAQLHIINVTSDFVRTAVSEVSQKFQLSADGKQVRWRGGKKGTQLSSDSGTSSAENHDNDNDNDNTGSRKRRKVHIGRFQPVSLKFHDSAVSGLTSKSTAFHYKPLFYHHGSSSADMSTDDSEPLVDHEQRGGYSTARKSSNGQIWNVGSHSLTRGKRRHEEGPMIFYSGAKFCTDLSGDREGLTTPLHATTVGKDGHNKTGYALGSKQKPRPVFPRTASGSAFPFRPFKDYSKGPSILETGPKTPELLTGDLEFDWFVNEFPIKQNPGNGLQKFEASGLGGTQPADHFALRVETARPISISSRTSSKVSKFSAPGPNRRRFHHNISQSSLDTFHNEYQETEDVIARRLATLGTVSQPTTVSYSFTQTESPPIKPRVLSTKVFKLQPSQLPPPLGYYATYSSSSISDSESSEQSFGVSHLHHNRSYLNQDVASPSMLLGGKNQVSSEGDDESEEEDDEEESSFEGLNTEEVTQQEQEFNMEIKENGPPVVRSTVATVDAESDLEMMR